MRIIKARKSDSVLEDRTGGDPPKVSSYSCLDTPTKLISHCGIFFGFGNNMRGIIWYKLKMKYIFQCHYLIIDEHSAMLQDYDQSLTSRGYMMRYYPMIKSDSTKFCAQLPQIEIKPSDLDFIQSPFDASKCISLEIILPPKETDHGLTFDTCQISHRPALIDINRLSPFCPYIPSIFPGIIVLSSLTTSSWSLRTVLMSWFVVYRLGRRPIKWILSCV